MYLRLVLLCIVNCICFSHNKYDKLKQHAIKNGAFISNRINIDSSSSSSAFFISTSDIPSNTTILSIPFSLFINTNTTLPFLTKQQKRLYTSLSSFFLNNTSTTTSFTSFPNHITNLPLRVNEIFLSYIQSTSIPHHHHKNNKLFKHFKHFFNLHSQSELDTFPIYYTTDQMQLLVNTSLGSQIELTKQSLEDEAITIKGLLNNNNTSSSSSSLFNYEEYFKYRVLTIAKGVYLNDDVHLIPFIDLFMTHPVNYKLHYEYDDETQMLNVITIKDITKGENMVLQGYNVSNLFSLLFYGKTFGKEGDYLDTYMIPVVHKLWVIERENVDDDDEGSVEEEEGDDVFYETVDLGKDDWYVEAIEKYKTLCKVIGKEVNDLNAYTLMHKNFNMFMDDYAYVKDYMYDKEFFTKNDALNVRRVVTTEKALLHDRIVYVERMIMELSKRRHTVVNEEDL